MFHRFKFLFGLLAISQFATAITISQNPLFVSESVPPLSMLVLGKDHSLFFEAYNDASDIDGDGTLDLRFKPSIEYYGLFDSKLCYTHSGGSANNDKFTPSGTTTAATLYSCRGSWSGNWLNYITTSRVDALRKVLYGGYREVDTAAETILRRAYIPQDGHSWAKEYTSVAVDGYNINDYAPISAPTGGKRLFFGNVTMAAGTNCATLNTCSNLPPVLSVVASASTTTRVWDWASSESPVLNNSTYGGGTRTNYTVRVAVCTDTYHATDCQGYAGHYKPVGLLHEYGADNTMLFGLLTGSYNKNMSGGVLRKVVSQFSSEINSDGTFSTNATIVNSLNALRIRDYNNGNSNSRYRGGSFRTGPMTEGDYVDWGNPIGEMMYETLRYFAGKATPTTAFNTSGSHDAAVGLSAATWDNPYASNSSARANWCAKPNMLVMSNVNVSYDSDQLPGSAFSTSFSSDLSGLDVAAQANTITAAEPSIPGPKFIGAVGANEDYAPTVKTVTSLSNLRGLAPEEPSKQGSYYSASVARFGAATDLNTSLTGDQKTDTYVVALASPLPKFEFTVGGRKISLVPFAKTINGSSTNRAKSAYQPTDPIVDLYVEQYSATGAVFRVNYEADEQGNDFDSDVIVSYAIVVNANGTITVKVTPTAQSTGSNQNLGYVISGTNRDGAYLVVQDKQQNLKYFLNVPPGQNAGYCDYTNENNMPSACAQLPWINGTPTATNSASTQTFSPSTSAAATVLNNPLWYAAKYGISGRDTITISGDPDNYFLVTNASTLKEQLRSAFNKILQNNFSVSTPSVTGASTTADGSAFIYRTDFKTDGWTGDVLKQKLVTSGGTTTSTTLWKASEHMPAPSSRTIYMANAEGTALADFTWSNLKDKTFNGKNLRTALNKATPSPNTSDNYGEARVGFVRGSCSGQTGCSTFRSRTSLLGDIINSSPVLVKGAQYLAYRAGALDGTIAKYTTFKSTASSRTPAVYVGSNDGMLHAFNANTGAEIFAFIPTPVIENLNLLTAANYGVSGGQHQYYVDGSISVTDVYYDDSWHTVLVGSLAGGGRGVFALDVTTPSSPTLLWEFTSDNDSDMGYSAPKPVVARLHSGQWAALIPNGYNSSSGKAVLFALDIQTGTKLAKLEAQTSATDTYTDSTGSSNGLANIRTADFNSDGVVDYVYAGDMLGNIWRFDLYDRSNSTIFGKCKSSCSAIKDQFRVSFSGTPFYVAKDSNGARQPITAAPTLVRHPTNLGYLVVVGTGRYVNLADKTSPFQTQTLYSIWDRQTAGQGATSSATSEKARTDLQEQTISESNMTINGTSTGVRLLSQTRFTWYTEGAEGTADTDVSKWGWYIDLKTGDASAGERLINPMTLYGQGLILSTIQPDNDACEADLRGFTYGINPYTGGRTAFNLFDMNGDGVINAGDSLNGSVVSGYTSPAGGSAISGGLQYSTDGKTKGITSGSAASGRQLWRLMPSNDEL